MALLDISPARRGSAAIDPIVFLVGSGLTLGSTLCLGPQNFKIDLTVVVDYVDLLSRRRVLSSIRPRTASYPAL